MVLRWVQNRGGGGDAVGLPRRERRGGFLREVNLQNINEISHKQREMSGVVREGAIHRRAASRTWVSIDTP